MSAASAPVTSLVGRHLAEIFISEYTMELCNRALVVSGVYKIDLI